MFHRAAGIVAAAEMYVGCVAGALPKEQYLELLRQAGFQNLEVRIEKPIVLPEAAYAPLLSSEELETFQRDGEAIASITVYGEKPS